MATCPNGHQLKTGAVFCTTCGADAHVACANGHRNAPDVRYCETCGATVGQASAFPVPTPKGPVSSGDASMRAEGTPLVTQVPPAPVPEHMEEAAGAPMTAQLDTPEPLDVPEPGAPTVKDRPEEAARVAPIAGSEAPDGPIPFAAARDAGPKPSARNEVSGSGDPDRLDGILTEDSEDGGEPGETAPPRSKKKWGLIGAASVVVIAAAVAAAVISSNHSPSQTTTAPAARVHSNQVTSTSSTSTSTSTTTTVPSGPAGWTYPAALTSSTSTDGGSDSVKDISCVTGGTCFAVDSSGNVLTSSNRGAWTTLNQNSGSNGGGNGLAAISCSSTSFCVAIGGQGSAQILTGSTVSDPVTVDQNGQLKGISCASTTFCVAVDNQGNSFAFTGSATNWTTGSLPASDGGSNSNGLNAVSCPTTTFCLAVGSNGVSATFNGSSWTSLPLVATTDSDGNTNDVNLTDVSCATSGFCGATDDSGNAYTYDGTSWSAATVLGGSNSTIGNSITATLSCPASGVCVAVNSNGGSQILTSGTWSAVTQIDGNNTFQSISCWASTSCAAVDQSNNVLYYGSTS